MNLKNKKGAEKILAVYWFAILILVSAGIFSMVFSFQAPYDVRELEASVLTGQVADCVVHQGVLDSEISNGLSLSSIDEVLDKATLEELTTAITDSSSSCNCGDSCDNYAKWIEKYSEENNILDPLLVAGLMVQESLCNSSSASGSSVGLMQINLDNCGNFDLSTDKIVCKNELIANPEKNIEIGIQILKDKYNSISSDGKKFINACTIEYQNKIYFGWEAALRGYNGWGCGVFKQGSREGEKITFQDSHVENVLGRYNNLREIIGKEPVSSKLKLDLLDKCDLNFEIKDKDLQYYFEVDFINFTSGKNLNKGWEGNPNLKIDCSLQLEKESKTLSKCFNRSFYSVDKNNQKYIIKILSLVRKTEQNVDG